MSVAGGTVHKDASTLTLGIRLFLSKGVEKPAFGVTDEVIHSDLCTWEQVVDLQSIGFSWKGMLYGPWFSLATLFGKLAGGAQRSFVKAGCCVVKSPCMGCGAEETLLHHPLHLSHVDMAQALMPPEDLLFRFSQVEVGQVGQRGVLLLVHHNSLVGLSW